MELEKELNVAGFDSERSKGIINVLFTSKWIEARQMNKLKPYDLSIQQYNVLRILYNEDPQPLMLNVIQSRMLDRMSNASRLVDKLMKKGLIVRKVSETDRRQVDITITNDGKNLLQKIDSDMADFYAMFDSLNEKDFATLNGLLDKLRKS